MRLVRKFSRVWQQLHILPRSAPATYFPALFTSYTFPCAWHQLHMFPHFSPATRFPALGTSYILSSALHHIRVFPRLIPVKCFPAPTLSYTFPSTRLRFCFPALEPVKDVSSALRSVRFIHTVTVLLAIILKSLSNVNGFDTELLEIFGVDDELMGTITWREN